MAMTANDLAADRLWEQARDTHLALHTATEPEDECEFCEAELEEQED